MLDLVLWSLFLCSVGATPSHFCFSIYSYPMGIEIPESYFYSYLGDSERNRYQSITHFSIKKGNNELMNNEVKDYGQIVSSNS